MKWLSLLIGICLFGLVACGFLAPAEASNMIEVANTQLASGEISADTHAAVVAAINSATEGNEGNWVELLATGVSTLLLGYFGITRLPSRTGITKSEAVTLKALAAK